MKTMRYILIVLGLVSVLSVSAQYLAQKPEAQMRSTSGMMYSGSTLPQAAATGAVLTASTPGQYAHAARPGNIGLRKDVGGGSGWADEDATEGQQDTPPELPGDTVPLGDGMIPLALLACVYLICRAARIRRREV